MAETTNANETYQPMTFDAIKIGLAAPVATVTGIILNVGFYIYLNRTENTPG